MKNIKIIIIDDYDERAKELKSQIEKCRSKKYIFFAACRKEVFINELDDPSTGDYDLGDGDKKIHEWEKEWEEDLFDADDFDLIFLHIGENKYNNKFYKLKCEAKGITDKVIGYTGALYPPPWYNNSNYLVDVGGVEAVKESFHFKEFFQDWFYNERKNLEQFEVPWNFRKLIGRDLNYLPVISLLCQSYLGVYAESGEYQRNENKTLDEALEKMGWFDFRDVLPGPDAARQVGKHFKKGEAVGDAAWFKDFFEDKEIKKDALIKEIKDEWGDDQKEELDKIIKLIDAFYDADNPNYNPLTVAEAYLASYTKVGE